MQRAKGFYCTACSAHQLWAPENKLQSGKKIRSNNTKAVQCGPISCCFLSVMAHAVPFSQADLFQPS